MIYFGNPSTPAIREAMEAGLLGAIETPAAGSLYPKGVRWCADNGVYGKGWPGDDKWFKWLTKRAVDADTCAFAVAPDVVGDGWRTLIRSRPWLRPIQQLGYPVAFALQDGSEKHPVPWRDFDVAFIGGTTEWKLGSAARTLVYEAKEHGKWVHMGRVNSEKRWRYARLIGCDSADGTYLTFGPDANLPDVLAWLRHLDDQLIPGTEEPGKPSVRFM